mgnify:CR=1 FL=1
MRIHYKFHAQHHTAPRYKAAAAVGPWSPGSADASSNGHHLRMPSQLTIKGALVAPLFLRSEPLEEQAGPHILAEIVCWEGAGVVALHPIWPHQLEEVGVGACQVKEAGALEMA